MTREVVLGLDVGTTNVKVLGIDLDDGRSIVASAPTPWRVSDGLGRWMDPDDLLDTVAGLVTSTVAQQGHPRVAAVGVTGMAESGVATGPGGEVVVPVLPWDDLRGAEEVDALERALPTFPETTGLPLSAKPTLVTWRWWSRTRGRLPPGTRWANLSEWVVAVLGGDRVSEPSLAARTGWFDLARRDWWDDALDWSGARRDQFGPLVPAGTPVGRVTHVAACAGAVLAVAGHDHPCATVGAGATDPDVVVHSCGTAEVLVRSLSDLPPVRRLREFAVAGFAVGPQVVADRHLAIGGHPSGSRLSRVLDRIGLDDPASADRHADAVPFDAVPFDAVPFEDLASLDDWLAQPPNTEDPGPGVTWAAAVEVTARASRDLVDAFTSLTGPVDRLVRLGGWGTGGRLGERRAALDRHAAEDGPDQAAARGAVALAARAASRDLPDGYCSSDGLPGPPTEGS